MKPDCDVCRVDVATMKAVHGTLKSRIEGLESLRGSISTIERHIARQNGSIPRMSTEILEIGKMLREQDDRVRCLERSMAAMSARVNVSLGLLVPIAAGVAVSIFSVFHT